MRRSHWPFSRTCRLGKLLCLPLVAVCIWGCGNSLGEPITIDGASVSPPEGWTMAGGTREGTVLVEGEGCWLSAAVLKAPALSPGPADLMKTLEAVSEGLTVTGQSEFSAANAEGKEFIVSYQEDTSKRGVVYLFRKEDRLCVLTFVTEDGGLEEKMETFRTSAASLRFSSDGNQNTEGGGVGRGS